MKKFLGFFLMVSIVFICGCTSVEDSWQEIVIEDCGTFKIPNEWTFYVEDDIMYIMEAEIPIMISSKDAYEESNQYFKNYKYVDYVSSAVLSNGPIYGKAKYAHQNTETELYYLHLGFKRHSDELVGFIVWNQNVSEELLIRIAETFVAY